MRILPATLACTAALLLARLAPADPLAPASLPANTQWVIHLDLDAARDTSLWQYLQEKFFAQPTAQDRIQAVENFTGMKFPDDLHDVTLYGPSYAKEDAAVLIHAAVNQAQITDLLKQNPDFASTPHNDHDILTWRDNGRDRLLFGSFFAQDRIIVAPTEKLVADALDALDKKIEVLKPASPLLGGLSENAHDNTVNGAAAPEVSKIGANQAPHPIAYLAGLHLAQLQKNKNAVSPIIAQADAGWITVSESDKKIIATAAIFAKSDKAARQILVIAQGLKAALDLSASDDSAAPPAKIADTLLENLALRRDREKLIAELPLSLETFQRAVDAARSHPKPAAIPATAP